MSTTDLRELLTPAAREMLDELTRDFQSQVLLGAAATASQYGPELREISVADIARSYGRLQPELTRSRRSLFARVTQAYIVLGIVVTVIGWAGLGASQVLKRTVISTDVGLVLIGAGLWLVLGSIAIGRSRGAQRYFARLEPKDLQKDRDSDAQLYLLGAFMKIWSDIEVLLREKASEIFGESEAQRPLRDLVQSLERSRSISAKDVETTMRLLTIRNAVVHGRGAMPDGVMRAALDEARHLAQRLGAATVY